MDEVQNLKDRESETEEIVYKTKVIQFLGRETPIVLQNDNGPCPLIAICNVLLLRNSLNLSLDVAEVSQQKLLALVAEKLIDANSNVQDKDDGYVSNQQQNISDAIDLLPRLATGIDVNVHFRKINDFEFTRECAIFDLFDISLVHGWIVDPQDIDTADAIGSKTYNTLVAELVAFQAKNSDREERSLQDDDYVDFAAATTATLGVPSPSLSRGKSFDDCPVPISDEQRKGKGDILEEEELMRAINVSRDETSETVTGFMSSVDDSGSNKETGIAKNAFIPEISGTSNEPLPSDIIPTDACNSSNDCKGNNLANSAPEPHDSVSESNVLPVNEESEMCEMFTNAVVIDAPQDIEAHEEFANRVASYEDLVIAAAKHESPIQASTEDLPSSHVLENQGSSIDLNLSLQSGPGALSRDANFSNGGLVNVPEAVNVEGSEPIYEGEECIVESGSSTYNNREPVYEGEAVLAEQAERMEHGSHLANAEDEDASRKWLLVKNFLEHNASQLTIYGLFCLQDGLKERELCVFFRNNHFSTMFKFNGELYLLATDQGYINQPDLVWEKLNEVNGDTVFMTGNFMEFNVDNQGSQSWNEQSAMTHTADYLARLENSAPVSDLSSDLQLAIALQQQEFEQQPQRQQQHPQQQHSQQHSQQHPQQSSVVGRSRLVTGPQVSRNQYPSQKSESKAKEKCNIM